MTCSALAIFPYWTCKSLNNLLSYCGLINKYFWQKLYLPVFASFSPLSNFWQKILKIITHRKRKCLCFCEKSHIFCSFPSHYHLEVQANTKKSYKKKPMLFLASMGETGWTHDIFFKFSLGPFEVFEAEGGRFWGWNFFLLKQKI